MNEKKGFLAILLLTFSMLFSLFYVNYFNKGLYIRDFKEEEVVEVLKSYNENKETLCFGNKVNCHKVSYKIKGKVNVNRIGIYKLTYIAKYKNEVFSRNKIVKVVDTKKPVLSVEGSFTNVCKNGKNDAKVKAIDNYDGDISKKVKYTLNKDKLIYKVTDSSGNTTKKVIKVVVLDNEAPKIVLNADPTYYLMVGNKYEEPGFVAIDNCDGDVSNKVKIYGNVNYDKEGSYEIAYKASDSSGNETTIKRLVRVFSKNEYNPSDVSSKVIYLTFDDGPGEYTARLLDILKQYNVKATFFVTGYNNNYNDLLKREADEGHTVALHSYTHDYKTIYTSIDAYMEDLLKVQQKVKDYTGQTSMLIRFPGGSSNTISRHYRTGIMSELTQKVEELGFRYFDWTILSGDAGDTKDPNKIVENVTTSVSENALNVVLMHDIKPYTVDSVERIIQFGLDNGYTFAPLSMNSPVVHQKVNN